MFAPATMLPQGIERLGAKVAKSREEAIAGANVVMGLRIQLERMQGGLFPSLSEYNKYFGVGEEELKGADKDPYRHAPRSRQPRRGVYVGGHRRGRVV